MRLLKQERGSMREAYSLSPLLYNSIPLFSRHERESMTLFSFIPTNCTQYHLWGRVRYGIMSWCLIPSTQRECALLVKSSRGKEQNMKDMGSGFGEVGVCFCPPPMMPLRMHYGDAGPANSTFVLVIVHLFFIPPWAGCKETSLPT